MPSGRNKTFFCSAFLHYWCRKNAYGIDNGNQTHYNISTTVNRMNRVDDR